MAIIGDALRQEFIPKQEYVSLREEEEAWGRMQRSLASVLAAAIGVAVVVAAALSMNIVFPSDPSRRLFCGDRRVLALQVNKGSGPDRYASHGASYVTDEEATEFYWMVVFVPSVVLFSASVIYLLAGIVVTYSSPARHICLKVVENNYCASKRGGVRCLFILNAVFAVTFGFLALFLGSSLLSLGSNCSIPLFWCYEIAAWGLAVLYGGTAFLLRRKAASMLDDGFHDGRNLGLEMLESATQVPPDVQRRVNEGFRSWMGSSLLSDDDEDEEEMDYRSIEEAHPVLIDSSLQRE